MYQVKPLRVLEMGPVPLFTFQVSGSGSHNHHLVISPFEEPLIGTLLFRLKAVLRVTFVISLMFYKVTPYFVCSTRQILIFYLLRDRPIFLYSMMQIPIRRHCFFGILLFLEAPFLFEAVIPSPLPGLSTFLTFPPIFPCWLMEVTPCFMTDNLSS